MSEAEPPPDAKPPAKPPISRGRKALFALAGLLFLLLSLPIGAWFLLPKLDLAGLAADRASALLGRQVTIESLRVTPGQRLRLAMSGVKLANVEGGTRADMLRVETITAELDLMELLRGEPILRDLHVEGVSLILERNAQRVANWHFGTGREGPALLPDRSRFPQFDAIRIARAGILFRTTGGLSLPARIESASLMAEGLYAPIMLRAQGQYNGVPLTLEGPLDSIGTFRDAATPFSLDITATAGETSLAFIGSARDPLNLDGVQGQVELRAPNPDALLALGGSSRQGVPRLPIELAGTFDRQGRVWRVTAAYGEMDGAAFTGRLLQLTEAPLAEPDTIALDLAITRLDLNRVLRAAGQEEGEVDLPLTHLGARVPLIDLRLSAGEVLYGGIEAREARLSVALRPEMVIVESLVLQAFGARLSANAQLEPVGEEARLTAEVAMTEADLDTLRRAIGLTEIPLTGRMEGRFLVVGRGRSLNEMAREAGLLGVLAIPGGTIAREVMDRPPNDARPLQRASRGRARLSCALAVLEMEAGVGEIAPLRLRAPNALVSGSATFDLNLQRLDLLFASHRPGTGNITLEAPVRISGSFAEPEVQPAQWTTAGRARLSVGDQNQPLPPALRDFARRSPCFIAPTR
ncbi:MAG: AsmA family protein [Roseococcus sp.]|nr:AsmA family protein [Roseococcus sp.]